MLLSRENFESTPVSFLAPFPNPPPPENEKKNEKSKNWPSVSTPTRLFQSQVLFLSQFDFSSVKIVNQATSVRFQIVDASFDFAFGSIGLIRARHDSDALLQVRKQD